MQEMTIPGGRLTNSRWMIAIVFLLLAGFLRYHKLGDWPFAGDETATLAEEASLFSDALHSPNSPVFRLTRAVPLSYAIIHVGDSLFGRDEFGSRVLLAFLGTAIVPLTFLLLDPLKGRFTALATALLLTLWPDHVFQSQQTRFYIIAAFFSFSCVLTGAMTLQRRSAILAVVTCCLGLAAILSHTVTALLLGIVFVGIIAGSIAAKEPVPRKVIVVFLVTGALAVGFYLVYLRPLLHGWNQEETWGYSIPHAVLGALNMIGWPIGLFAVLGFLLLCHERSAQNWYWLVCALGFGGATVILPRLVTYHPAYVFAFALGAFVLAGSAVGKIGELLATKSGLLAMAWTILACLMNLPSLASHYVDGSRCDMRTAAQYVEANWQEGDRVTGFSMALFRHYAPKCISAPPLPSPSDAVPKLEALVGMPSRLWVVVESSRGGLPEDLRNWLGRHCSHELQVRRKRFDYSEYCVDVFLHQPEETSSPPVLQR